ncbi:MAG: Bacterial alpha-L-rhamnosidase [Planctomycetes bacterium]|nr:Bacterial alpha-L-rhamnosidase [Planctomycetota bacterium]
MNRIKIISAVILICALLAMTSCTGFNVSIQSSGSELLSPAGLRCEYLVNPLGVDVDKPRLSWICKSSHRGQKQTAYHVLVASSREKLAKNVGDLWDTGKVQSDRSIHVAYDGKELVSSMQCFWKVMVWDMDGKSSKWSEPGMWSMGLLKPVDWQGARWIGIEKQDIAVNKSKDNRTRLSARYLRRDFEVTKKVARATAYVCGLGFFDLHINGRKVGDHIMDPGLTDYRKRAFYVTFDVGDYLASGKNCVGIVLGNGRYFAPRETSPGNVKSMGYPKLMMHMRVEYEGGTIQDFVSGPEWKVTTRGPIRSNNEFDGEEYDARMEMPGWDSANFDDSKWKKVELVQPPGGVLQSQMIEPMRIIETRNPQKITSPKPGMYIVDMGQAYYGSVRLKVSGSAGIRVQMRSAYNVNPDGTLRMRDNRTALSTDVYILKGKGIETWHPRFKGQGYRYVEVTGFGGEPKSDNFEGLVIHTDFENHGEFSCSNPLINRIFSNIRWTQRAYIRSLSMEPDRDERQGWLGTQAKDFESNAYNFHMAGLLTKWLGDIRLDQLDDGQIPDVSPTYWSLYHKGIVWPSNIVILPEIQHDFYGDRRALEHNYDTMKKWMKFISGYLKPDFTVDHNRYGDWVDVYSMDGKGKTKGHTPPPLLSTAYYYNNCRTMARVAGLLGKTADQEHFKDLGGKIKQGFNKRFFDPKKNRYGNGTQTSYILPLAFDMVDPDRRDAVAARLVDDIMVTHNKHLSVGMVGMLYLMQVLTDTGYPEVAYTIAAQETRPSWGYMVSKGATTVWERWDSDTAGAGMNSEGLLVLAGNLEAWFYKTLAGINHDPQNPGFKHVILRPNPVGDLTWAKASYKSMYGKIVSDWKIIDDTFKWKVTVPPNSTATVYVPGKNITEAGLSASDAEGVTFLRMEKNKAVFKVESGKYEFKSVVK